MNDFLVYIIAVVLALLIGFALGHRQGFAKALIEGPGPWYRASNKKLKVIKGGKSK